MLCLEPGDHFHVLHVLQCADQSSQWPTGWPYFFSMEGKYEAGPFGLSSVLMGLPPHFTKALNSSTHAETSRAANVIIIPETLKTNFSFIWLTPYACTDRPMSSKAPSA